MVIQNGYELRSFRIGPERLSPAHAARLRKYLHEMNQRGPGSTYLRGQIRKQERQQSTLVKPRISVFVSNLMDKDFWNHAIFFVSKDENLTKAHIRYLEGRLIELARTAGRALVTNGQGSGAKLPESDSQDMEIFLEKMCQLLPVLGVELLVPVPDPAIEAIKILICEIRGHKARGYRTPNGFLVLKNSEAVAQERASSEKWPWPRNMRQALKTDGILSEVGDRLIFSKNYEFASPSAAASVVHGGHANGLTAWKTSDGKLLKELESV
jgi:hypothetical protein